MYGQVRFTKVYKSFTKEEKQNFLLYFINFTQSEKTFDVLTGSSKTKKKLVVAATQCCQLWISYSKREYKYINRSKQVIAKLTILVVELCCNYVGLIYLVKSATLDRLVLSLPILKELREKLELGFLLVSKEKIRNVMENWSVLYLSKESIPFLISKMIKHTYHSYMRKNFTKTLLVLPTLPKNVIM